MGEFWFGQVAKCVIQSDFQCPGGAEPIRPFGDHSGLSVEAFDNATGELFPRARNQFRIRSRCERNHAGETSFIGSSRERIVRVHQRSRNWPAQYGDT